MPANKRFKVGQVLAVRWFIPGFPTGLCTDTRLVVREVAGTKRGPRFRVEREDGRSGSWWLADAALREWGTE